MKKLPIGIQSIREILEEDQIYVGKTEFALNLILKGKHYFISRPRRFGKSLFLNTLEEIFKECKIYKSNYSWQRHPVLYFDFARIENRTSIEFENALKRKLQTMALFLGMSIETPTLQEGLEAIMVELAKKYRVIVLVDEYDNTIINNLKDPEIKAFQGGNVGKLGIIRGKLVIRFLS